MSQEDSKWSVNGLFHQPIDGIYWGYNPLILTIDPIFLGHPRRCVETPLELETMSMSFPPKKITKKLQELLIQDVSQGRSRLCVHDPCSKNLDRPDRPIEPCGGFLHSESYKVGSNRREKLEWNHPHVSPKRTFGVGFGGPNISNNKVFGSILGGSSQLVSI